MVLLSKIIVTLDTDASVYVVTFQLVWQLGLVCWT